MTFTIAYNEHRGTYEVHRAGCAHLNLPKLQPMFDRDGDVFDVARWYEQGNEGIFTLLAPCAATGKARKDWNDNHDARVRAYLEVT